MKKSESLPLTIWKMLSSLRLAFSLLLLLGVQTWLATLEMVDAGLLNTLHKYFHWTSWYVVPEINGKSLFLPLPGGYWTCALLLANLTLGGLIRMRKGWKTAGVLLAHFGIIFMVAAGGVSQLFEKRGVMMLVEGEQADYAISLTEPSIEVMEIVDGRPVGMVQVADDADLRGMDPEDLRLVRFPGLPFDLELTGWQKNATVQRAAEGEPVAVDGWKVAPMPLNLQSELDAPATYARPVFADGSKGDVFLLAVPQPRTGLNAFQPQKLEVDGRTYAVRLVKETIAVPYTVKLDDAVAEFYPNSGRPKSFMSDIQRIGDDGEPVPVRIKMNEPMRREGFTFFQRTMSGADSMPTEGPEFSGFEVVSNPADKWPEYSLYVVTLGLILHFGIMFWRFVTRPTKTQAHA